jgi:MFS family permease
MTYRAYRQIFGPGRFRVFWAGFTCSVAGDALSRVALTWLVYDLTRSAAALGWLMVCYTGPIVLGGLLAGWLLDRFDRYRVMIADNLVRGATMALIPLLAASGQLALWHLYAAAAVYGFLMMIALAGGATLIPSLVREDQLATANALEMLAFTLGGVLGPVAAGLLIVRIGAPNVIVLDVGSYLLYALALARIRGARPEPAALEAQSGAGFGQAVRLLLGNPVLLATTLMFLTFNIGGGMLAVWLPILADRRLAGGPQLYGALLGILAGGEVAGAAIAGSLALRMPFGTRICIAQACSGAALALLLLDQQTWLVALGLALYGFASAPLTIWAQTLRMRVIPDYLRGRSFALLRMLMQSGNPIGGALAGLLMPLLGIAAAVGCSALLVGLPGVLGYGVAPLRSDQVAPTAPPGHPAIGEPVGYTGDRT